MSDSAAPTPSLVDDKAAAFNSSSSSSSSPPASPSTTVSDGMSIDNCPTPLAAEVAPMSIDTASANALHSGQPKSKRRSSASASASASTPRPRLKAGHSTPNMNGPLYMQTSGSNTVLVRRLKRKEESTWKHLARWFIENQIGLSFNLIALVFLAHNFIPKARVHTAKFFQISYHNPESGEYRIGFDDVYLILSCIVLFTGLRAATMEYVLAPFARLQGITNRKALTRFSEQAWLMVYYFAFWPMGVYLYYNSPYWMLNLRELWTDWPNRELTGLMKGYMLGQWAFWLQQILVIHLEDRRKDHWQMFTHHIITSSLIWACYTYHHTRIGNFILVIMDVVDLFLPLAKCLRYSGYEKACDAVFVLFVVSWFIARHVFYLLACWSIYAHTPEVMPTGCFKGTNDNLIGPFDAPDGYSYLIEPFFSTTGLVCYDENVKWAFLTPLLLLQALTIGWFTMIVRVVVRVLRGGSADDDRSDDEGEEEEEEEFVYEEAQPLEEEVGVEDLDLKNWERRAGVKKQASSSGVSLPGHSDRKELLGRIGCEKQVD